MADIENKNLHVVFLPYFICSHMLPLLDVAILFATLGGLKVSVITTPHNAAIFQFTINERLKSGVQIAIHSLKFPSEQVDLPEGIENFSTVTSSEQYPKLKRAIGLLQKPMENLTRSLSPHCIFSDYFFPWSVDLALELKIPRLLFFPYNFFYHFTNKPYKKVVEPATESSSVCQLPRKLKLKRSRQPNQDITEASFEASFREQFKWSYGTVHNTFLEIEPTYANMYKKSICKRSWHIGPLFHLCGRKEVRISGDCNTSSVMNCLNWLDTQKAKSVVYVCFGSMVLLNDMQLTEIVLALKASSQPFVLVTKKSMPIPGVGDFEENNGIIITGWAPQIKILNHPAVGAFMTHCGWDSVLEAMVAGVPLITCPLFAEQFHNEKLIIQILGNGVEVGSEVCNFSPEIKSPVIGNDKIKKAVMRLMRGSFESEMIRRRAEEISVMAKRATEEGGSSYNDLMALIQEIKDCVVGKE
ncbi:scopoletin glucosyltransferase [Heracleum sosnowskyi]|uniref:Glycosyltransferase n=1 Tax=Heracleum sosnowskyi TaxID=360622 RepID=A0AAD8HKK6_9APIA|nr:scopoletin glucosyltransferase [Heracleum sosnowskyi]